MTTTLARPREALYHQQVELVRWLGDVFTDPEWYETAGLVAPRLLAGGGARWAPGAAFEGAVGAGVDRMPANFRWALAAEVRRLPVAQQWVLRQHIRHGRSFHECDLASHRREDPALHPACERSWRDRYEAALTTLAGVFWNDDGERLYPRRERGTDA